MAPPVTGPSACVLAQTEITLILPSGFVHVKPGITPAIAAADWVKAIEKEAATSTVLGIVLPAELIVLPDRDASAEKVIGPQRRGRDFFGMAVLEYLRWSGHPSVRHLPVLVLSALPLDALLRLRPQPLLHAPGVSFRSLPDVDLVGFESAVRKPSSPTGKPATPDEDVVGIADKRVRRTFLKSLGTSTTFTHHELANDGYAAFRLLEGYRHLLQDPVEDLKRLSCVENKRVSEQIRKLSTAAGGWHQRIGERIAQPEFQQFCAVSAVVNLQSFLPILPEKTRKKRLADETIVTTDAADVLKAHLEQHVPENTTILLVDDRYQHGIADAIRVVLFNGEIHEEPLVDGDSVLFLAGGEQREEWPRMICVADRMAAETWVSFWQESERTLSEQSWLESLDHHERTKADRIRTAILARFGNKRVPRSGPASKQLVMILDLRLEGERDQPVIQELDSFRIRAFLSERAASVPVLIYTASRQVTAIIDAAATRSGRSEEWALKEAPDGGEATAEKSASYAVLFLRGLDRLMRNPHVDGVKLPGRFGELYRKYSDRFNPAALEAIEAASPTAFESEDENGACISSRDASKVATCIQKLASDEKHLRALVEFLFKRRLWILRLLRTAQSVGEIRFPKNQKFTVLAVDEDDFKLTSPANSANVGLRAGREFFKKLLPPERSWVRSLATTLAKKWILDELDRSQEAVS